MGYCSPDRCRGECCKHVGVFVTEPVSAMKEFLWFLQVRGVRVSEVQDSELPTYYMQFDQRCQHLNDDGLCRIYGQRPEVCRSFPAQPSDLVGLPEGYCGYSFEQVEEGEPSLTPV